MPTRGEAWEPVTAVSLVFASQLHDGHGLLRGRREHSAEAGGATLMA
jgi:hypothetical protein